MPDIRTDLAPYWYTPENQPDEDDKIRFRLKPLTQPQVVEIVGSIEGKASAQDWYRAGEMGLNGGREIEGLTINGKPATWPRDRDSIPYEYIVACGAHLFTQAMSADSEDARKN